MGWADLIISLYTHSRFLCLFILLHWTDEGELEEGRQGDGVSPFMREVRLLVSYLNVESICWVAKKFLEERKLILSVILFVSRDRGKGST